MLYSAYVGGPVCPYKGLVCEGVRYEDIYGDDVVQSNMIGVRGR